MLNQNFNNHWVQIEEYEKFLIDNLFAIGNATWSKKSVVAAQCLSAVEVWQDQVMYAGLGTLEQITEKVLDDFIKFCDQEKALPF